MVYLGLYLIICLCFTPIINRAFNNIDEYGFFNLLFLTIGWPICFIFIVLYITFNKVLDFFEDYNDRNQVL